jgi:hypothetical protein
MVLTNFYRAVLSCVIVAASCGGGNASAQPGGGPQVMGWVPASGVDAAIHTLTATPAIGQTMTRVGLQFWNPNMDGTGLVLTPVDGTGKPVTAADIRRLQRWARQHGVQALLSVFNNSQVIERWDWAMARHAFADHREAFITALVAAVDAWQLDGVDLDFEGEGDFSADRPAYAAFVHELASALKARGKLLTIDSSHNPCIDAPNMRWWSDWVGDVATIHSMGAQDVYEGNTDPFTPEGQAVCAGGAALLRYSWQVDYGMRMGYRRDQIVVGMPTWVDSWGRGGQGTGVVDHLREVRSTGAGIGLTDLQLSAPGWTRPGTWEAIQSLRHPGNVAARQHFASGTTALK